MKASVIKNKAHPPSQQTHTHTSYQPQAGSLLLQPHTHTLTHHARTLYTHTHILKHSNTRIPHQSQVAHAPSAWHASRRRAPVSAAAAAHAWHSARCSSPLASRAARATPHRPRRSDRREAGRWAQRSKR